MIKWILLKKQGVTLTTLTEKFVEIILKVRSTDTVYRKIKTPIFPKVCSTVTVFNALKINKVSVLRTFENRFVFMFYKQCQSYGLG